MNDKMKNVLIGIFTLTAIVGGILLILFVNPSIGDGEKKIEVRFSDITGVNVGTRVLLAGKPVGEVEKIQEIVHDGKAHEDKLGRVYFYQLTLKVDSGVELYSNDEVRIQTTGLLGEKTIGIIPMGPKKGKIPHKITDKIIYGSSIDPIQNTLFQMTALSEALTDTVKHVDAWFVENRQSLTHTVESLNGTLTNVNTITKNLADGEGTFGKLLQSDDFYLRMTSVMSKVDTLMNDINNYGLLFQYDKHWKRIRTKKANLVNSLQSPQEFRRYFNSELDAITVGLGRISTMLDRAQASSQKEKIMQSAEFKEDFADLLRQVRDLSESLKLYNQELMETHPTSTPSRCQPY